MKKLILISSTLFAFAFIVGCGQGKLTKDECDQDDKKMWDAEKEECVDKAEETGEPDTQVYTITNVQPSPITVSVGEDKLNLGLNKCVRVIGSDFASLKVSFSSFTGGESVVCDSIDEGDTATENDCVAGNYQIVTGKKLVKKDAINESADCKTLGSAPAPAPAATPATPATTEGGDNAEGGEATMAEG